MECCCCRAFSIVRMKYQGENSCRPVHLSFLDLIHFNCIQYNIEANRNRPNKIRSNAHPLTVSAVICVFFFHVKYTAIHSVPMYCSHAFGATKHDQPIVSTTRAFNEFGFKL